MQGIGTMIPWAMKFVIGCWIVFLCYWFVSARSTKRTRESQGATAIIRHRLLMLLAFALLVVFARGFSVFPFSLTIVPESITTNIIGASVCFLGLAGAIWARRTLAGNWSSSVTFKENHELIQNGPYRFVRHPIYTSILTMFLGSAIVIGRLGGFLGLMVYFGTFWIKSRQEEALMLRHFSEDYAAYRKRVKALIPYVF